MELDDITTNVHSLDQLTREVRKTISTEAMMALHTPITKDELLDPVKRDKNNKTRVTMVSIMNFFK
jgi:hypothetical protein